MATKIPFERLGHLIRIPVSMPNGGSARFLVDTGIGITVVNSAFARRHRLDPTGRHFVGTRMAGDKVTATLMHLPGIELGDEKLSDLVVAVADLGDTDGPHGFDGILGLDLLGNMPLTVDPFHATVCLGGEPDTAGIQVPVTVERDAESVCLYVDMRLPDGTVVTAEVDTGSGSTILDSRYMVSCAVTPDDSGARTVRVVNETGVEVERSFIPVPGPISLLSAPETSHRGATVMFQDISLDGLIGTAFLDRYVQTFDTRTSTLTLTPRTS
jgi:hypothetical protein